MHVVPLIGDTQVVDMDEYKWETLEKAENQSSAIMSSMSNLETDFLSKMDFNCSKGPCDLEERLCILVDAIKAQNSDDSLIVGTDREESFKIYLHNIIETQMIMEKLGSCRLEKECLQKNEIFFRLHAALQMAMSKLEEQFLERLLHHGQQGEADRVSFNLSEEDLDDFSINSFGDQFVQGRLKNDDKVPDVLPTNLISPEALPGIKDIVRAMFLWKYEMECCQAYISVRKDYLESRLSFLHIEKLSIEDILEMDSRTFCLVVRRWNHALKMFVQVYLSSEKHLSEILFGDFSKSASNLCFFETGKSSILQLLNFAQAVVIGTPSIENLFRVLDMYEVLSDLLPDIKSLFPEDCGCSVMTECLEILSCLNGFVKKTFVLLKDKIRNNTSSVPFSGGGIHPLTKYVMNYIQVLSDYRKTLNLILDGISIKDVCVTFKDASDMYTCPTSTLTQNLLSVTSVLESNLESRSMLYQDASLKHFFLMNNIYYMVRKAKNSDLSSLLGKAWLLDHTRKYRQYANQYERASWGVVLSYLKYEGICSGHANSPSARVVKERFSQFNNEFEDIYKTQTSWLIADDDLREDLRISIGQMLLPAYRTFHGRYAIYLDGIRHKERYLKYSPDDLQRYLLDLFEGSQKSFPYYQRK